MTRVMRVGLKSAHKSSPICLRPWFGLLSSGMLVGLFENAQKYSFILPLAILVSTHTEQGVYMFV